MSMTLGISLKDWASIQKDALFKLLEKDQLVLRIHDNEIELETATGREEVGKPLFPEVSMNDYIVSKEVRLLVVDRRGKKEEIPFMPEPMPDFVETAKEVLSLSPSDFLRRYIELSDGLMSSIHILSDGVLEFLREKGLEKEWQEWVLAQRDKGRRDPETYYEAYKANQEMRNQAMIYLHKLERL